MSQAILESSITVRSAEARDWMGVHTLVTDAVKAGLMQSGAVEFSPALYSAQYDGWDQLADEVQTRIYAAKQEPDRYFTQVAVDKRGHVFGFACAQADSESSVAGQVVQYQGLVVNSKSDANTDRVTRELELARLAWAEPLGRIVTAHVAAGNGMRPTMNHLRHFGFQHVGAIDSPRRQENSDKWVPWRHYFLLPRAAVATAVQRASDAV